MDANSQQQKHRNGALFTLNAAIEALNLAKEVSGVSPTKAVFGSVGILLSMIRVYLCLFRDSRLRVHMCSGLHGRQQRLCRTRVILR